MVRRLKNDKRGNSLFVMLMFGVLFFILGLALAPAINDTVKESMNTPYLNCSATNITEYQKAECTSIDVQRFLFIGAVFGFAGIILGSIAK